MIIAVIHTTLAAVKVKPKARIDSIGIRTHDRCDPGAVLSFALILALASEPTNILVPRAHDPSGLWQGSRVLAWSNTGSPRFTDFPSNLANLIGWEYGNEYSAHSQKTGSSQSSRSLPQARRIVGSGGENEPTKYCAAFCASLAPLAGSGNNGICNGGENGGL